MPVITRKNGYYPYEEVIFVGPDESGTYTISNSIEGVPQGLDPLEDASMRNFIGEIDRKEDTVFNLDYTDVDPTYREQILRVTGEGLFRKAVYLSGKGDLRQADRSQCHGPGEFMFRDKRVEKRESIDVLEKMELL